MNMRKVFSLLLAVMLLMSAIPAAYAVHGAGLTIEYDQRDISYKTVELDIAAKREFQLTAKSGAGRENAIWNSNDNKLASVSSDGLVTVKKGVESGSVTISCLAADGSGRSCAVKLVFVQKVHRLSLEHYMGYTMRSQSIVSLSPKYIAPGGVEYKATVPKLRWEVLSGGQFAYFSNPSSGTLCTNYVDKIETVRIGVSSEDNPNAYASVTITIRPNVQSVSITKDGVDISGRELYYPTGVPVKLLAKCSPSQPGEAIKWSSSAAGVSVVDGLVTADAPCRVTITASAADGSGKSASVTINFA